MMRQLLVTATVLVAMLVAPAMADTIHVPSNQPTIQAGINAAAAGDTVLVAPGTYAGAGNRGLDFGGVGLTLMSAAGRASTTIDCEGIDRALYFQSGEDTTSVVSGFTIVNGYASYPGADGGGIRCLQGSDPKIADCTITYCEAINYGGGMACEASCPVMVDVVLSHNSANFGGALSLRDGSSPVLRDIVITHNEASSTGGGLRCEGSSSPTLIRAEISSNGGALFGGGVYCKDSSPVLVDAVISGNMAELGGGMYCQDSSSPSLDGVSFVGNGAYLHGGGLGVNDRCSPVLNGCRFIDNQAAANGGGIYVNMNTVFDLPVLSDCRFERNKAWGSGGGLYLWTTPMSIESCDFVENEAVDDGGGLVCYMNATPSLFDCTFVSNTAGEEGGGLYCWAGVSVVSYTLFTGNSAGAAGGGVSCGYNSHLEISSATFVSNSAPEGGGIYRGLRASADVSATILGFSGAGGAVACYGSTPGTEFTRCCVFGNTGGNELCDSYSEIIYSDPRFCGFYDGDYSLCDNSPCLSGNNAWGQLIGAYAEGCDSCDALVEEQSWGSIKALYR